MGKSIYGLLASILLVIYPLIVLIASRFIEPYFLLIFLGIAMIVRLVTTSKTTPISLVVAAIAAISATFLISFFDPDLALKLYPACMTGAILCAFASSLFSSPSMIERFARIFEPDLPEAGVKYTYNVTMVWCIFLLINLSISLWTVFYTSINIWSLYNGFISYCLMGLLMGIEFIVRKKVRSVQ